MTCEQLVIIADTNTGTDYEPTVAVMATCNGVGSDDCGWMVEHRDVTGDPHTPGDWWVTSDEMEEYVRLHQEHNA